MTIEYTGRGTTVTAKLKQMADAELKRIDAMIGRSVSAHVILTEDKYRQIAEVTMKTPMENLVATCEDTEMEKALHGALRKIEQQAVKHKEKRNTVDRHAKPNSVEPMIELTSTTGI